MRRTILLAGIVSFAMAFAGTMAALTLAAPGNASAQEQQPGYPVSGSVIVGEDGTQRIRAGTGPGGFASIRIFAPDGATQRAELVTGGNPTQGGGATANAAVHVFALDGTRVARMGTGGGEGTAIWLADQSGRTRVQLSVAADGTGHIGILDANGNVTWSVP